MSIPAGPVPIPPRVIALAEGSELTPVWLNELGGLTFRAGTGANGRYIKYGPLNAETSMEEEALRMDWARTYTPVPKPLGYGHDDSHEWLVTRALPFAGAVEPPWIDRPRVAVRAIGTGLRAMHDSLPVEECPFSWGVAERLSATGRDPQAVEALLGPTPKTDRLVVCHGDACAPNTLIGPDGEWAAHVDLGNLGVADRWADLAVASNNLSVDFGPGWEPLFFEAYGVDPDPVRIQYYQDLWDAT